jgi:hypothetical protein
MRFVITKLTALAYTESNAASAAMNGKKFAGLSTRSISSALSATAKLAKRNFDSVENEMGRFVMVFIDSGATTMGTLQMTFSRRVTVCVGLVRHRFAARRVIPGGRSFQC